MNLASPLDSATEVIAAVSVVLPWSTCPIVPTFTCGLVRSNLPFAISILRNQRAVPVVGFRFPARCCFVRHWQRTAPRRRPACLLSARSNDRIGHVLRSFAVVLELHRVRGAALRHRTQRR